MAKLTQPLGSSEARGKLGGYCYNTWRGISYVKTIKAPGNQNSPRRLAARALAKLCTLRWQTISDADRSAWNFFATLHLDPYWTGNPKRNSGYNWFLRANVRLLAIGLSIIDTPPVRPNQWPILSLSTVVTGTTFETTWTLPVGSPFDNLTVDIWLTKPQSPGRQPKIEDAKHLSFTLSSDSFYDSPGLPPGSYGLFARTIDNLTGLTSPWILSPFIIPTGTSGFQGPSFPTIGESLPPFVNEWADANLICLLDGLTAEAPLASQADSDHLFGSHFDFLIPTDKSIAGVIARAYFYRWADCVVSFQLRDAFGLLGNPKPIVFLDSDPPWLSAGSDSDLWGATLTPAVVNADGFGLDLTVHNDDVDPYDFDVDVLELTIYWTT